MSEGKLDTTIFARRGCTLGIVLGLVMISGLAYMAVLTLKDMLPPDELQPYASKEETLKLVQSKAAAPGPGARLSEESVRFYIGAFDSLNVQWNQLAVRIDSTVKATGEKVDLIRSEDEFKEMIHLPLYARRGLVNYLNARGKSWDEYLWAKKRVVAASGITQADAFASFRKLYGEYFVLEEEDKAMAQIRQGANDFYNDVEAMRKQGIDSAETALVAPYRDTLLREGLHSLMEIETMFSD